MDGVPVNRSNGAAINAGSMNPFGPLLGELVFLTREPRNRFERRSHQKRLKEFLRATRRDMS
jgi:hypothetical protein